MNESTLLEKIITALYSDIDRTAKKQAILSDVTLYFKSQIQPGKAAQAAAWLQDRPNHTQAYAAKLFGVSVGAVAAAKARGPYPKYEGQFDGIPDAPPRRAATIRQPGKAAQAAAWLQDRPNSTIKRAALLFGVSVGAVAAARFNGPYPRYEGPGSELPDSPPPGRGKAVQAAAWLQDRPFRTMREASKLFGVTVPAIAAARANGPYDAYVGPLRDVPDNPPANLDRIREAVRWANGRSGADPLADAARLFGVKLSHVKRWAAYSPSPR